MMDNTIDVHLREGPTLPWADRGTKDGMREGNHRSIRVHQLNYTMSSGPR